MHGRDDDPHIGHPAPDPVEIRRLTRADLEPVVAFALAAWAPVFASLEDSLGAAVFGLLFPDWRTAQATAIETVCATSENQVWVAVRDERPIGFVATTLIDEDAARAGEVVMIAVHPHFQRSGVGGALLARALAEIRAQGVELAVIGTGGDSGHRSARALYERFGFRGLPLVRYYRRL